MNEVAPQRIASPGIYTMPAEQYHADPCSMPSLSNSIAKALLEQSPMHAWLAHPRLNPKCISDESSRFDLGSAAHAILLEGDWNRVEEVVADDWKTKAAREARDQVRADGKLPVLSKHFAALQQMVPVAQMFLESNEDTHDIMTNGQSEATLVWIEDGVYCRCRPDRLSADRVVMLDYKTTSIAEPNAFCRQIERMAYDVQAAWYLRGARALGFQNTRFIFLAQEITRPYACCAIGIAPSYLALGDFKIDRALKTWRACMEADRWPAYPTQTIWAEVPDWAEKRWNERDQLMAELDMEEATQ